MEDVNLMEQFGLLLIQNADKITGAVGIIIVLVVMLHFLDRMGKRAEDQTRRDDEFRAEQMKLNIKIVDQNERSIQLFEAHEKAARERADQQAIRDKERDEREKERMAISRQQTSAMQKITDYLGVLDDTKETVDKIESTVIRTQGNLADLQTDIPALITRKSDEVKSDIAAALKTVSQNYELTEKTLSSIGKQLSSMIATMQDDSQQRDMQSLRDVLDIVLTVVNSSHKLVESLPATIAAMTALTSSEDSNDETEQIGESS